MTMRTWTEDDLNSAGRVLVDQWRDRALRTESANEQMRVMIERDRSTVADGINGVLEAIRQHEWLRLGRGSYEYNDDRWKDEFGEAIDGVMTALGPLKKVAGDLSNCPTDPAEIEAARMSIDVHWRLIDSAPTDGTPVLIKGGEYISDTSGEDGDPEIIELETPIVVSYYDLSISPYGEEWVWAEPLGHPSIRGFGVRNPTHWAPL